MLIIYSKQNPTWLCQKCVHIHHKNINYHIVNVFYVVVRHFHVLIFQVHNQIITIPMLVPQYVPVCIILLHVVPYMTYVLSMIINSVNCVSLPLIQNYLKNYIQKRACNDGKINCGIPSTILHTYDIKTCIALVAHAYYWNT